VVWQGHDPGRVRRLAAGGSSGGEADAGPEPGVRTSRWRSRTWTWPPRGIAVRLHGLHESPLDRALDRRLLGAGWMLLHFDSIQLGGIGFAERPGGRTELALDSAEEAGGLVDEILAQVAVAATEVLGRERDWLREHEGLDDAPVIVVGTSLGGILSPTVAALVDGELRREGSGLAAMVLLAAGGDLGGISAASPAMDLGPDLVPPLALLRWKGLMREAIAWSRLDPLHVAPALRHVPTLMLHGRFDDVVPARFGDRLWRALGRPDRYRYLVGHYGLLGLMTGEADAVMRWLRRLEAAAAGEERRATR
jgi:alpha-beta hydrolase superfamily lysophospholipase